VRHLLSGRARSASQRQRQVSKARHVDSRLLNSEFIRDHVIAFPSRSPPLQLQLIFSREAHDSARLYQDRAKPSKNIRLPSDDSSRNAPKVVEFSLSLSLSLSLFLSFDLRKRSNKELTCRAFEGFNSAARMYFPLSLARIERRNIDSVQSRRRFMNY